MPMLCWFYWRSIAIHQFILLNSTSFFCAIYINKFPFPSFPLTFADDKPVFIKARSSGVCSWSRGGCEADSEAEFACWNSPTCFFSQRVAHGPFDGHFRPTSFHGLGGSRHSSRFDKLPCITGIWPQIRVSRWYAQRDENNENNEKERDRVRWKIINAYKCSIKVEKWLTRY